MEVGDLRTWRSTAPPGDRVVVRASSIVVTIVTGIGHSTGLLVSLGLASAMQLHVGAAVASIPLALWHVLARKTMPHRTDVSRRNLLRGGVLVGGAAVGYVAIEGLSLVGGLPGRSRRSTGSYERGSFQPDEMPVTQWLNDAVPAVDPQIWTLPVADAMGSVRSDTRSWSLIRPGGW